MNLYCFYIALQIKRQETNKNYHCSITPQNTINTFLRSINLYQIIQKKLSHQCETDGQVHAG